MNVNLTYTFPEPQPDIVSAQLLNVTIDPLQGTWSGMYMVMPSGRSFAITDVPLTLFEMTTIMTVLVASAQAAFHLPAGTLIVS